MSPQEYELRLAAKRVRRLVREIEMWPHVRVSEALALQQFTEACPHLRRALDHLCSAVDTLTINEARR